MYFSFYGLKENPFQISTNPRFLWLGEKHQEALATFRYGIADNKGFLLLTGDVGTGKTTLINALLASLDKDVLAVTVPDPGLNHLDLLYYIATAFGIQEKFSTKGQFLVIFSRFLHAAHAKGKKVLLIIDEAQRLSSAHLEEIRLLSNIERPDSKLINIFFVGQIEFNAVLLEDKNRALRQRITVTCEIPPLTLEEVGSYLRYRLRVAGATRILFSADAVKQIHLFSRGYPRLINVIADRALLTGFVNEAHEIGPQIVVECAHELQIRAPKPLLKKNESVSSSADSLPSPAQQHDSIESVPKKAAAAKQHHRGVPVRGEGGGAVGRKEPVRQGFPASIGSKAAEGKVPASGDLIRGSWRAVLLLLLLLAIAGGFYWYFHSERIGKHLGESAGTIPTSIEEQDRIPQVTAKENTLATMGENDNAVDRQAPGTGIERQTLAAEKIGGDAAPPQENIAAVSAGQQKESEPEELRWQEAGSPSREEEENESSTAGSKTEETLDPAFLRQIFTIGFDHNSNNLTVYGAVVLDRLAEHLAALPYRSVIIRGYTDATGTEEYNKNLSLFRASIVRGYLMAKGLNPETIVIKGLGSADPVAGNTTLEGQRKNRRVEIEVLQ